MLFNSGGGGGEEEGVPVIANNWKSSSSIALYLHISNHLNACNHPPCNFVLDVIKCMFSFVCMRSI